MAKIMLEIDKRIQLENYTKYLVSVLDDKLKSVVKDEQISLEALSTELELFAETLNKFFDSLNQLK